MERRIGRSFHLRIPGAFVERVVGSQMNWRVGLRKVLRISLVVETAHHRQHLIACRLHDFRTGFLAPHPTTFVGPILGEEIGGGALHDGVVFGPVPQKIAEFFDSGLQVIALCRGKFIPVLAQHPGHAVVGKLLAVFPGG